MPPQRASTILFSLVIVFLSFLSPLHALGQGETKEQKIQHLASQLQNGDENEQIQAAFALGRIGKEAMPALIHGLKTNRNSEVLDAVASAFGEIGKDAVPELISILEAEISGTKDIKILRYTCNALKNIAEKRKGDTQIFKDAVPLLMKILEERKDLEIKGASNYELQDFDAAADCLAYIGKEAKDAVPLLIELTKNEQYRKEEKHYRKKDSIVAIIKDLKNHSDFSANQTISDSFDKHKNDIDENDRREIEVWVNELNTAKELQDFKRLVSVGNIFREYPSLAWTTGLISLIFLVWLSIFYLRPLWLLKLYKVFPIGETRLSGVWGAVTIPLQYLLASWVFRPRVLDAWVKKNLSKAYRRFSSKQTVKDRRVYVPVGLFLDDKLVSEFTPQDLGETFACNQSRLLISGVGGSGKTSLACQFAKWAMSQKKDERLCPTHSMLPVLLEHDFVEGGEDALKKEICAQLSDSIDADTPISNALLQALLEQKRVLVLVDGMSEMNETTRHAILSGITAIPVNAVVFTSRSDETIGELNKTIIKPTTIKGNQLSSFVERYLTSLGRKELFEDEEFFEGCRLLSKIVNDRDITALLAKLFVEQMVAEQEKTIDEDLPKSIPELMLQSIKVLHAKTPSDALTLRDVIKAAKVIAWECLQKDYHPLSADYEETKKSLANLPNGERSLTYLKDKLKLIETTSFDEKIRFKIDPLAEYLAGMYLVEENKYNQEKWHKLLDKALAKAGSPENIKGFLLAVRDCCLTDDVKNEVPGFVVEELTAITRIDRVI